MYKAVADALERDVLYGKLEPGQKLPTHRDLADFLGVTVGTVTRAYGEAEKLGLIQGTVGKGTFVRADAISNNEMVSMLPSGSGAGSGFGLLEMGLATPFYGLEPSLKDGLERIMRRPDIQGLLRYDDPRGLVRHRETGADWLRNYGIETPKENVLVTVGGQHALAVCCAGLFAAGDRIAADALTYPGLKTLANSMGLKLAPVELDGEGMLPDALDAACRRDEIKGVHLMPSVHNPTTACMGEERRRAIARVAARHGLWIIEDDAYCMSREQRPAPVALLAPERTIFVCSLSKCVTGGLRTAFLTAPSEVVNRLSRAILDTVWMSPPLMAELACQWIRSGAAMESIQLKRAEAAKRNRIAVEVLSGQQRLETKGLETGFFRWLELPAGWSGALFEAQAKEKGLSVFCAEKFAVGGALAPAAVRISVSGPDNISDLKRGLKIIKDIVSTSMEQGPSLAGPML